MPYPPATTSHHHHPPPPTYPAGLPRGGGVVSYLGFWPKFHHFWPIPGVRFCTRVSAIFYRFLPSKMRVLGFRRGKTAVARPRPWCPPFCARVSAIFFTDFYRTKCVFGGFVEVKWPFLWLGLQKCSKTRGFLLLGLQKCSKIRGSLSLGLPKCFKIREIPSLGLQKCRKIHVFLSP